MAVRQTIPFYEAIQMQVVDIARTISPEAECWFDTGCGTGYLVELAIPHFPKARFILVDPSQAILDQAKSRRAGFRPERVRFLPPIANEDFGVYEGQIHPDIISAVLCNHCLHREGRHVATEASYRLLAEEGLFITVENITPAVEADIALGLERWKRFQLISHHLIYSAGSERAGEPEPELFAFLVSVEIPYPQIPVQVPG